MQNQETDRNVYILLKGHRCSSTGVPLLWALIIEQSPFLLSFGSARRNNTLLAAPEIREPLFPKANGLEQFDTYN